MKIKDAVSPLSKDQEVRPFPEKKPSQYAVDLPGINDGYTRHPGKDSKPNTAMAKNKTS